MALFNVENEESHSDSESLSPEEAECGQPTCGSVKRKNGKQEGCKKKSKQDEGVLPKAHKSNKNKSDLYKQPSAEELNHLKETENLFNSNIFRLQIDELLSEIRLRDKHTKLFTKWYSRFHNYVENIMEYGEIQLDGIEKHKSKRLVKILTSAQQSIKSMFTLVPNCAMKFDKPTTIFTFGKYSFIPNRELEYSINICMTIPKTTFYEKDYLNSRYQQKKLYYIFYLMHHIKESVEVKQASIEYYMDNEWLPILSLTPSYSDKVKVNIFVVAENDSFKLNRFLPSKNNIKQNTLANEFKNFNIDPFIEQGTILYNSVLLHDLTLQTNQNFIEEKLAGLDSVLDGIKLLMVWLTQRNLGNSFTGFTRDILIYMIIYLCVKKKVHKHMSSYQVVRIFWSFLSSVKSDEVFSIGADAKPKDVDIFKRSFGLTLLDATGSYNVAAFLDPDLFLKSKYEAKLAIKALDNYKFNCFTTLFVTKMPDVVQYDAIIKVKSSELSNLYNLSSDENKFRYFGYHQLLVCNCIKNYLRRGLRQRVLFVTPLFTASPSFGINFDAGHFSSVIEKGPKQFEYDTEDFKQFWGPLAELRRFKDSSIYEAVYFKDVNTVQDKRLIFKVIIDFVLKEKLNLEYDLYGTEMEKFIQLDNIQTSFDLGSNEEVVLKIKSLHNELIKILRELKLPLAITAIQGISDVYSYTDVFPPIPTNYRLSKKVVEAGEENILFKEGVSDIDVLPHLVAPIESVIQLALHSKWPRNLNVLRAIKKVYNFEIAKLLKQEHSLKTTVGDHHLDVFYQGLVFRFTLYHPKEVVMLKENVDDEGVTFYKDTKESLMLERRLNILPNVCGALNGLHQEHSAYGPSTCLIKRWLRSQLLDDSHIPDIVVNLLNASLFLSPEPFTPSTLPQVAFVRFLKFICEHDFTFQPVIVNFNNNLSKDELQVIETQFMQNSNTYSRLFIITPYDQGLSVFTKDSPSEEVMRRIKVLAAESYKHLCDNLHRVTTNNLKALFMPNLKGYDLLIHTKLLLNPRRYQQVISDNQRTVTFEDYKETDDTKFPITNFNPVSTYLKELRENYGDYALFFHDSYGGTVIGVLWRQKALEAVEFKISTVNARKCSTDPPSLNRDALIEDFYTMGSGLVKNIEVQIK